MEDTACAHCGFYPLPEGARFCQQCGCRTEKISQLSLSEETEPSLSRLPSFLWPVFTILFSLGLSWFLIAVLHWPIFILGAFLPLAWQVSKDSKKP